MEQIRQILEELRQHPERVQRIQWCRDPPPKITAHDSEEDISRKNAAEHVYK